MAAKTIADGSRTTLKISPITISMITTGTTAANKLAEIYASTILFNPETLETIKSGIGIVPSKETVEAVIMSPGKTQLSDGNRERMGTLEYSYFNGAIQVKLTLHGKTKEMYYSHFSWQVVGATITTRTAPQEVLKENQAWDGELDNINVAHLGELELSKLL